MSLKKNIDSSSYENTKAPFFRLRGHFCNGSQLVNNIFPSKQHSVRSGIFKKKKKFKEKYSEKKKKRKESTLSTFKGKINALHTCNFEKKRKDFFTDL